MINLNMDELLKNFFENENLILSQIDNDELLAKKQNQDGLVIANASKQLNEVKVAYQQLAKGIVYKKQGDKFKFVSLPMTKMWNAHEWGREQESRINELLSATKNNGIVILEKLDGTLVQRFVHEGKVYFTTRGVIDGVVDFESDYIEKAKEIAAKKYPNLLNHTFADDFTLIFELIFPEGRVVTNYGDEEDLYLIGSFSHEKKEYSNYGKLKLISTYHTLNLVKAIEVAGSTYKEKMENALNLIKGSDKEGFIMTIEDLNKVLYRVKFKSPDWIKTLRLLNECVYKNVVELIQTNPNLMDVNNFRSYVLSTGGDDFPPDIMQEYMDYHSQYINFCKDSNKIAFKIFSDSHRIIEKNKMKLPLKGNDRKNFAQEVMGSYKNKSAFMFKVADGLECEQILDLILKDSKGENEYLQKLTK